jgi:hypothetical protein
MVRSPLTIDSAPSLDPEGDHVILERAKLDNASHPGRQPVQQGRSNVSHNLLLIEPVEQSQQPRACNMPPSTRWGKVTLCNQCRHHHQSQLQRMGRCVGRCKDDNRAARSAHPSLPHPRDRKRQLPVQSQLCRTQIQKGKITRLTHPPHRGTYLPPGSLLDENPGSTLSANQHRADC